MGYGSDNAPGLERMKELYLSWETEARTYKAEIERLKARVAELEAQNKDLSDEYCDANIGRHEAYDDLSKLAKERDQLRAQYIDALDEWHREAKQLRADNERLKDDLKYAFDGRDQAQDVVLALVAERDQLRAELDTLKARIAELEAECDENTKRAQLWEDKALEAMEERDQLQSRVAELGAGSNVKTCVLLTQQREAATNESKRLALIVDQLRSRLAVSEGCSERRATERDELQGKVNLLEYQRDQLRAERDNLLEEMTAQEQKFKAILKERDSKSWDGLKQILELEKERDELRTELSDLEFHYEKMRECAGAHKQDADELRAQVARRDDENQQLREQTKRLDTELERILKPKPVVTREKFKYYHAKGIFEIGVTFENGKLVKAEVIGEKQ